MLQGDVEVDPSGVYGDWVIVTRRPYPNRDGAALTYELWNPLTGATKPGWQSPAGQGDDIAGVAGEWLVTVRSGSSLPFENWSIILRNPLTGEERALAHSDPNVVKAPGLPVRLPRGFAPIVSVSGHRFVWAEFIVRDGIPRERIQIYDFDNGNVSTLVEVDPLQQDLWQPTIGGDHVAWAYRDSPNGPNQLVVLDLTTKQSTSYRVGGDIYSCALSGDGRYLAWDDSYTAKFALDLTSGKKVRYAGSEGWGTFRSGHYLAWQPGRPGPGGYYDLANEEIHFLPTFSEPVVCNLATVMGGWFVWQELHRVIDPNSSSAPDISGSYYYFVRLPS